MTDINALHSAQTVVEGIHIIHAYEYANAAARIAATGLTTGSIGKAALQVDEKSWWVLSNHSPVTWISLASSTSTPFTSGSHAQLRQLVHLAENGPYELLGSGSTLDTGPQPFPTASIWRDVSGKKMVEKLWTRNVNKTPSAITWKMYDSDGTTVLAQAVDSITYQGTFEVSRTRTIT